MRSVILALLIILSLNNFVFAESSNKITINVQEKLYTNIDVCIKKDSFDIHPKLSQNSSFSLVILPLPFKLSEQYSFVSAPDIKLAAIAIGESYSIISIIAPVNPIIRFSIKNGYKLIENTEGKSLIEFNNSFPYVSQPERELFKMPITIKVIDLIIKLPKEYNETEVGVSDFKYIKRDKQTYSFDKIKLDKANEGKHWIVFPSPIKSKVNLYQLIFALFAGFFTLIFHFRAIKTKNIYWIFTVFILSAIIVGLFSYSIFAIPKPLEFMVWSAAAIPHAIFGFIFCIYLIIAKRLQASLTGQVTINNYPAQIATVFLYRKLDDGSTKLINKINELDDRGRYTFSIWQGKGIYKYLIKSKMHISNEIERNNIEIVRGEKKEIPPINLMSAEITQ